MKQREAHPTAVKFPTLNGRNAFLLLAAALTVALGSLAAGSYAPPAAAAQQSPQRFEGQWLIGTKPNEEKVQLTLRYSERNDGGKESHSFNNWSTSFGITLDQLAGLTREQMSSSSGMNVRFQLKRDAGTIECEGWFRDGKGSGHFSFSQNPAFAAELRKQGIAGEASDKDLFSLAMSDVGFAFVSELKSQGYETPTLQQLVRMAHHGVRLDYLKGLKALGYKLSSLDMLVRMRDHGVTLAFIQELRDAGYTSLTAEELVRTRDHGVSVSFLREMKTEGYEVSSIEELIRLRDHGVSASFVRELREEGYKGLPLQQLVRLKDHGVSISFIRELKSLGYTDVPTDKLIRMRDHGVTASFIRRVKSTRSDNPTIEELITMRDRGSWN